MAAFAGTARIVLNGSLGQGERFSTGFWIQAPPPANQAAWQAAVTAFCTAIAGSVGGLTNLLAADGSYQNVAAYYYTNPDPSPAQYLGVVALAGTAGGGGGSLPLQAAVVASLRTANPSRAGRGRMYIPISGAPLTNHELTSTQCNTIGVSVKGLFTAAATAFGPTAYPIINSSVSGSPDPVTSVITNSRVDTQRRRAESENVLFTNTQTYP